MAKLSIIIPCYFNAENIPQTTMTLLDLEKTFPEKTEFQYILVDDGSKDNTWSEMLKFKTKYPDKVTLVKLAGNVGSYNAILAGMEFAKGDVCTMLAADLQDPPELIPQMFDYWLKGIKLIICNRSDREEGLLQKLFSNSFHYLIRKLGNKNLPPGGFDLVMFDISLNNEVVRIKEKNTNTLFLLPWLGYEYVTIPYVRRKREVGVSRWTFSKKVKLFIDSFVSFSFFPLRLISVSGLLLGLASLIYLFILLILKLQGKITIEGWSMMMAVILLTASFQMVALGVLGEYIWRILDQVRNRPIYVVEELKD
jgi:glycosyltransferase involved in cell wall biosynthesis